MKDKSFVIRHWAFVISPLFRLHHRPPCVMSTIRAHHVRRLRRATLRARLELLGLKSVVRATHAGAGIRLFAFWNGHRSTCAKADFSTCGESTSLRARAGEGQVRENDGRDTVWEWVFSVGTRVLQAIPTPTAAGAKRTQLMPIRSEIERAVLAQSRQAHETLDQIPGPVRHSR